MAADATRLALDGTYHPNRDAGGSGTRAFRAPAIDSASAVDHRRALRTRALPLGNERASRKRAPSRHRPSVAARDARRARDAPNRVAATSARAVAGDTRDGGAPRARAVPVIARGPGIARPRHSRRARALGRARPLVARSLARALWTQHPRIARRVR